MTFRKPKESNKKSKILIRKQKKTKINVFKKMTRLNQKFDKRKKFKT